MRFIVSFLCVFFVLVAGFEAIASGRGRGASEASHDEEEAASARFLLEARVFLRQCAVEENYSEEALNQALRILHENIRGGGKSGRFWEGIYQTLVKMIEVGDATIGDFFGKLGIAVPEDVDPQTKMNDAVGDNAEAVMQKVFLALSGAREQGSAAAAAASVAVRTFDESSAAFLDQREELSSSERKSFPHRELALRFANDFIWWAQSIRCDVAHPQAQPFFSLDHDRPFGKRALTEWYAAVGRESKGNRVSPNDDGLNTLLELFEETSAPFCNAYNMRWGNHINCDGAGFFPVSIHSTDWCSLFFRTYVGWGSLDLPVFVNLRSTFLTMETRTLLERQALFIDTRIAAIISSLRYMQNHLSEQAPSVNSIVVEELEGYMRLSHFSGLERTRQQLKDVVQFLAEGDPVNVSIQKIEMVIERLLQIKARDEACSQSLTARHTTMPVYFSLTPGGQTSSYPISVENAERRFDVYIKEREREILELRSNVQALNLELERVRKQLGDTLVQAGESHKGSHRQGGSSKKSSKKTTPEEAAKEKLERVRGELVRVQKTLTHEREALSISQENTAALQKERDALNKRSQEQEARLKSLDEELRTLRRQLEAAEQTRQSLVIERDRGQSQSREQKKTFEAQRKQKDAQIAGLQKELAALRERLSGAEKFQERIGVLEREKREAAAARDQAQSAFDEARQVLQRDLETAQKERDQALAERQDAKMALERERQEHEIAITRVTQSVTSGAREKETQIEQLERELRTLREKPQEYRDNEVTRLTRDNISLRRDLDAANESNGRLEYELRVLQFQLSQQGQYFQQPMVPMQVAPHMMPMQYSRMVVRQVLPPEAAHAIVQQQYQQQMQQPQQQHSRHQGASGGGRRGAHNQQ